jgi:L-arabinose isomerase
MDYGLHQLAHSREREHKSLEAVINIQHRRFQGCKVNKKISKLVAVFMSRAML